MRNSCGNESSVLLDYLDEMFALPRSSTEKSARSLRVAGAVVVVIFLGYRLRLALLRLGDVEGGLQRLPIDQMGWGPAFWMSSAPAQWSASPPLGNDRGRFINCYNRCWGGYHLLLFQVF